MITIYKQIKAGLIFLISAGLLTTIGCKKGTFDINDTSPNAPSTVPPKYALSAALKNTASLMLGGNGDFIGNWMGYWAQSGDYTPSTTYVLYQLTSDSYTPNWDAAYLNLENYKLIENLGTSDPTLGNYKAAAMIMQSFVFQRIVDLYNNAPYTDALTNTNFTPPYTDAADIYKNLVSRIDSAILLIDNPDPNAEAFDDYDVVYGGDMDLWKKFANTLKLKILLRQTETSGGPAYIQSELSGLTTDDFLGAGEDAGINPGYSTAADNQLSPLYADIGYNASGAQAGNNIYFRANSYAVKFYYDNKDPRVNYFYEVKDDGLVHGRNYGSSLLEHNTNISGVNGVGVIQDPGQDAVILPAFESLFLQAEAIQRTYLGGDASATYQDAVTESFRMLGVTDYDSAATVYTSQANNNTNFVTSSNKIQTLIIQKWAACNAFDPLESFSDWRRLKIPANLPVSVYPGNTATHIPYRLEYPTSEHSYNAANVNSQGDIDILNSKIFWMP